MAGVDNDQMVSPGADQYNIMFWGVKIAIIVERLMEPGSGGQGERW
jgi:hypothetical protein